MFAKYTVTVFTVGMTKLGRCCTVSRGGGVLPYLGYTGTCRWTGYVFLASLS